MNSLRQDFARHLRPPLARPSALMPPVAWRLPNRRWVQRVLALATPRAAATADDQPAPLYRDDRMARLEAVLFLAKEPLHARKLARYANLADGTEALTLIRRLNILLDQTGRAFRVEEVAGGWQLRTRPEFVNWLRRLPHTPTELRLSAPAMETLAVVAYRQPVVRAEIETIRGVACGEIIRQLMDRDLVRVAGRSDELGRPYLYCTTNRFLQVFGLRSIDELPRAAAFRNTHSRHAGQPLTGQRANQVAEQDQEEAAVATTISPTTVAVEETTPHRPLPTDEMVKPAEVTRAEDEDDDWDEDDDDDELDDDEDDEEEEDDGEWDDDDDDEGDEWEEVDDDEIGDDDDDEEEEEDWDDDDDEGDEWEADDDEDGEWIDVDEDEDEDEDYEYEYEEEEEEDDDEDDDWD